MKTENNTYYNFNSYNHYLNKGKKPHKRNYKALAGAALGVGAAMLLTKDTKLKHKTTDELFHMLSMAGAANVGGVLGGSIGASPKSKKKKWKEAAFQMMNTTIPMLMVTGALETCKRIKTLNNVPAKIVASFAAMGTGAMLATKITNTTKNKGEANRKYTIKDSVANFDDIVATIKLGFEKIEDYIPVGKILPFIYIYCGSRAGEKE